jgi:hypothetical protein
MDGGGWGDRRLEGELEQAGRDWEGEKNSRDIH